MTIADSPEWATVIRSAIDDHMVDVHTAMPGTVQSYDAATQLADVRPAFSRVIRQEDGTRTSEPLPVIPSVPVGFPQGGGFFVSFPISAGDHGLLIFSEYAIDRWRSTGQQSDPGDTRRHGLSGALFIPGVRTKSNPIADSDASRLVIGNDGGTGLDMDAAGIRLGKAAASEGIGLGDALQSFLGSLKTYLDAHVHSGVTTGGGSSGPPSPSPAVPTVASSKHQVEP